MFHTVLVVEHDWKMRKLLRANLEALGMVVQEAVSVDHGLVLLGQDDPDLIILDLDFPGVDVLHAVTKVHAGAKGQVPILALSAEPLGRQFWVQRPFLRFLQKPFSAPMLLQHVQSALTQAGTGSSARREAP